MELVIGISLVTCLAIAMVLRLLMRNVSVGRLPVTPEWIDELSIERYRPMMRLLDGNDFEFLRSQPGFTPRMATKLRIQRCQIFRGYMRCLNADFGRVCAAMKVLLVQSRNDRPDLAAILIRHQAMFALGILRVECHLFFYRWGIGAVDVSDLVKLFDQMRGELRTMVPVALPMSA